MRGESSAIWFCRIAFWEGVSYLLLLFVAVPVKYIGGNDILVRYVGMAHGLLFVVYALLLVLAWWRLDWSFKRAVVFFLASLVPFATFWVEGLVREERGRA